MTVYGAVTAEDNNGIGIAAVGGEAKLPCGVGVAPEPLQIFEGGCSQT